MGQYESLCIFIYIYVCVRAYLHDHDRTARVCSRMCACFDLLCGWTIAAGNYDANVLILALQSQGFDVEWFDKRKGIDALPIEDPGVLGLIANGTSSTNDGVNILSSLFGGGRHWLAVRKDFASGMAMGYFSFVLFYSTLCVSVFLLPVISLVHCFLSPSLSCSFVGSCMHGIQALGSTVTPSWMLPRPSPQSQRCDSSWTLVLSRETVRCWW